MATKGAKVTVWVSYSQALATNNACTVPIEERELYRVERVQNTTELVPCDGLTKARVDDLIAGGWTVNVSLR